VKAWRGDPAWAERYERLRAHATGDAPLGFRPLGLALLQHRGVVAWMTAEGSSDAVGASGAAGRERDRRSWDTLDARRGALVRLLAGAAVHLATRSAR
jgi:hypothetical protein